MLKTVPLRSTIPIQNSDIIHLRKPDARERTASCTSIPACRKKENGSPIGCAGIIP